MVYAYLEDVGPFFRHRKNTCIHLCYIAALSFQRHFDFSMQKYIFYIQADFYSAPSFCSCFGTTANHSAGINVNIKMYIFDHLRMYIFAILPLDRYIFLSDKIFL